MTLYMIPTPLSEGDPLQVMPAAAREACHRLRHFVVENERTARRLLKSLERADGQSVDICQLTFHELNEHTPAAAVAGMLEGHDDVGMMSEAGCPGVADPGALLAAEAHRKGVRVAPLAGPSAILLTLMASGLNGQNFAFRGYLPIGEQLAPTLRDMETRSRREAQTQLLIEAPYRNTRMYDTLLHTLHADTLLCVGRDLTGPGEFIRTQSVAQWRRCKAPTLNKIPTVFAFLAQ